MRVLALLMLLLTACGQRVSEPVAVETVPLSASSDNPLAMMASTVQIKVHLVATLTHEDQETGETTVSEVEGGWVGSGVIYSKAGGKSLILSANHVLDVPKLGAVEDDFPGFEMSFGKKKMKTVEISIYTFDGRTCNLKVLKLGVTDTRDTATGVADCDAGQVAKIAHSVPARGERIYVSGHPMGVPVAMVTSGYVAGPLEGYTLISAGAYGGNSGGPVFYHGEVVGLLVRGSREYTNISLMTPLESILVRVGETPPL